MVTGRRSFGGLVSTNIVSLTGQFHSLAVNFPFFFHALCKRFKPVVAVLPSRVHNAVESWERGGDGCEKTKSNRQRKSDSSHKNSCGHCIPHTANNLTFSDGVTCSLLSLWEMGHDFAIRVKSERECLFQYQRKIILTETISWKIKKYASAQLSDTSFCRCLLFSLFRNNNPRPGADRVPAPHRTSGTRPTDGKATVRRRNVRNLRRSRLPRR